MGTLITLIVCTNEIKENPVPVGQDFYQIWCLKCIVLTNLIDKVYKRIPKLAKNAFCISLTLTSEPMTDERELQDLVREFKQRGLQSHSDPPHTPVPHEEAHPAPPRPMQTRSARKKFKPEVRSKRNKDRHRKSGQTSRTHQMDPPSSVQVPTEEDEHIEPLRPPYLQLIRPGVQPPRWTKQFTLSTPSLPPGV